MIEEISLENFKSHKSTDLKLGNLTVLAGQNGVGKSSLIQSMLLLRQSDEKHRLDKVLDLNAPHCFIGKTKDAFYQFPEKEEQQAISITLRDAVHEYKWVFDASNESTYLNRINIGEGDLGYEKLALFTSDFQYISAARSANYETDNYAVEILRQLSIREGRGELTAQFLNQYGKILRVQSSLIHESNDDPYLGVQTTAWETEISTGVNVYSEPLGDGFEIRFGFKNSRFGETDSFSWRNVGFGLSYALPIIVAVLSANPGTLLLIENPEAHLHPYGQSKLAELICLAAQNEIQIIVETHSDHLINGILVQCRRFEEVQRGIDRGKVRIYSFEREESEHKSVCHEVVLLPKGRLKARPSTFFDQIGRDIRELM